MTVPELLSQIERRFRDAAPDDTATNDRLTYFAVGFISQSHGTPGPAPKDDAVLAEWRLLGNEVAKWQIAEDQKKPELHFVIKVGPVTEQAQ